LSTDFCGLCDSVQDDVLHLFMKCNVASKLWYSVWRLMGLSACLPSTLEELLLSMVGLVNGKRKWRFLVLIWMAVVWSIWLYRNLRIFNNGVLESEHLLELIKFRSWKRAVAGCKAFRKLG
jgi:hypothetical protein